MKRTTTALSALAAAAALLLAGCGSDTAGTASPAAPSMPDISVTAPTGMSDTGMSETGMSNTGMSNTDSSDASATDESSSTEETTSSDETSSAETSSDQTSSDETSSAETSSSDESGSTDTSATTTVGGGGLDATSTKWFDTYCTGLAPAFEKIKNISKDTSSAAGDPKKLFKNLSGTFTAMGDAFTQTAKSLDGIPAPTFDGGDTVASTVNKALKEFGPKFTDLGKTLATADPTDPASLQKLQSLSTDLKGVQDLGKFAVEPKTLSAIKEIPSCKPIFALGG